MAGGLPDNWLDNCLASVPKVSVTVFGDFCLDAYWLIEPGEGELSVETGLPVRRVQHQRYGLGGASNVVTNLAALGAGQVQAVGLIGKDVFGRQLLDLLEQLGADTTGMLDCQDDWQTMVYAKPHVGEDEQNRIDFGAFNTIWPAAVEALADRLDHATNACDIVVLNQQVPAGVSTPQMIEALNSVIAGNPERTFLADSRDRTELYEGATVKLNAHEAARICGEPFPPGEQVPVKAAGDFALRLLRKAARPVFVTCGADGIVIADQTRLHCVPGIKVQGPTDPVGAGDTVTAALAAVLGAGGDPVQAATLANIAASVTVRKLQTTGTASPEEILRAAAQVSG